MAAQSFIAVVAGRLTRVFAILLSAGSGDANKIPALDATGRLDISFMPSGIGSNTLTVLASEAISAGDLVNLYNNSGTLNVRRADATAAGKEANGVALAGISNGASGLIYVQAVLITGKSGLTPGAYYWLDTSPGAINLTAPSTAGNISQMVGWAESATTFYFDPFIPVTM